MNKYNIINNNIKDIIKEFIFLKNDDVYISELEMIFLSTMNFARN